MPPAIAELQGWSAAAKVHQQAACVWRGAVWYVELEGDAQGAKSLAPAKGVLWCSSHPSHCALQGLINIVAQKLCSHLQLVARGACSKQLAEAVFQAHAFQVQLREGCTAELDKATKVFP